MSPWDSLIASAKRHACVKYTPTFTLCQNLFGIVKRDFAAGIGIYNVRQHGGGVTAACF
jgi:hypothetical protein